MKSILRIGTRGSKLALWQANYVADMLHQAGFETEIVVIHTQGDKILDRSLSKIGSKGVFTEELETALRNGEIHIAQHSAKDLQSHLADDLELIAFTQREDVADVIVSFDPTFSLQDVGKRIGTSSVRRQAFFQRFYPHLKVVDMRGNLQTRIEKLKNGEADALALAYAGVHRMGYADMVVHRLDVDQFVPPVGQGSVAIEASKSLDSAIKSQIRKALNHRHTELCLLAERAFLKTLHGGCSIPAYCLAKFESDDILLVTAGLVAKDGSHDIRHTLSCLLAEAEQTGERLANMVLQDGGQELLEQIRAV
jgi:hydroxymethylbilane synthase